MANKAENNEFEFIKNFHKYLTTKIETSRNVANIRVEKRDPGRPFRVEHSIVQYDCHDIRVTVSNTAPTEPKFPAVVFMGVALFVDFGKNQDKVLQRWKEFNMPKVDLKNADQSVDDIRIGLKNQFPSTREKYFPKITHDERSHGYSLFPGESITYDMNVLLAECLELKDMKLWVEGTISRRHLYHLTKEISL